MNNNPIQDKIDELSKYSDFNKAQDKAVEYLGEDAVLFFSPKTDKKYRIYNPIKNKWVDFGQMGYEDFTKHQDEDRRQRYLKRALNIKGKWAEDGYSPNNLSIHILW
jgi:hypothetical protein